MKAEELMRNDWVYVDNEPRQVDWIRSGEVGLLWSQTVTPPYLKPIPLTPEILEKNGFALKPDGWLWCKEEGNEDTDYIFIQFRKGCEEVRLVELNFVNKVLAKYEQMHYVHELQHALRLCGIKKEIEL